MNGCSMPNAPASYQELCASCAPAYVECDLTAVILRSNSHVPSRFAFPPAPSADAGAAAKDDGSGGGATVKLRTNGQLQVRALPDKVICGSNLRDV